LSSIADSLILKRNPRYNEMVFNKINTVGWNIKGTPLDYYDFNNSIRW
jgi:hypothetical protein